MLRGLVRACMTPRPLLKHTIPFPRTPRLFSTSLAYCQQSESINDNTNSQQSTSEQKLDSNDAKPKTEAAPIKEDSASPSSTSAFLQSLQKASTSETRGKRSTPPSKSAAASSQLTSRSPVAYSEEAWDLVIKQLNDSVPGSEDAFLNNPPPSIITTKDETLDPVAQFEELWKYRQVRGPLQPAKPSDGRTSTVQRDSDVARAYSSLNSILGRNVVRHELRLGERYEKPNQKRRRLQSERHRRRFADAVRQKVQLVMELKSRGA